VSFDGQRDVVDRLDKIERHLAAIVGLLRELMGKPAPKGWLAGMSDEEYRRKFRWRTRADQAAGDLPPSGGVSPEEFWGRREA
jgi:hypothetical protein